MGLNPVRVILLLALSTSAAMAQDRGRTTVYPPELYVGDNVVTISDPDGIELVRYRASVGTEVWVPELSGCQKEVNIRVRVRNPEASENIQLTIYDCSGNFTPATINAEKWTIRKEFTGDVRLGADTCLRCEVITGGGITRDSIVIDSIVVRDPRFSVIMPSRRGPWVATASNILNYQICFTATNVEDISETIHLYIRRQYPNGGLTGYVIEKPVSARGVRPPPPKPVPPKPLPDRPPLYDPTTFRNIIMPTAEPLPTGKFFVGNYDIVGWLAGYGVTDDLMVLGGGAFVPDFITRVLVGTIGAKYRVLDSEPFMAAVAAQYAYTSTSQSDISTFTPYAVLSLGNRQNRISIAGGYAIKHHTTPTNSFDQNAYVISIGGDLTVKRGWKLTAETYIIESSGLVPLALTSRWFNERLAFDVGIAADFAGGSEIEGTGLLSGRIKNLRLAPILSLLWVF